MGTEFQPRVLILEDEADWRKQFAAYLARTRWKTRITVDYADTLAKAKRLVDKHVYDLVLIDLKLAEWEDETDFGGMEFLKVLDRFTKSGPTKSIVISAYGTPSHVKTAWKQHGILDYFEKQRLPEEEDKVIKAMEEAIRLAIEEREKSASSRRVLIVEDDAEWQSLLDRDIEAIGHQTKIVPRPNLASQVLKQEPQDLVVLDLVFDEADEKYVRAMSLLAELVEQSVPVIIVSGYGTILLADMAFRKYGVIAFIDKKHYDSAEFQAIVREIIGGAQRLLTPEDKQVVDYLKKKILDKIRKGERLAF